ncbi:MAG: hypothetical protein AAF533_26540 [Acidobacteriota bacterium]
MSAYRTQSPDTSREIEELQFARYRAMPGWRKLQLVSELCLASQRIALAGLKERHPEASERELQLKLAEMRLPPELFEQLKAREALG